MVIGWLMTLVGCEQQTGKSSGTDSYPKLLLTERGVNDMRNSLGIVPLFDLAFESVKKEVDLAIKEGIDVPIPKDLAGGYTHEQHKRNYALMQKSGVLFQITEDVKYAAYVRDMLFAYAEMYPTLGLHPAKKSYARGKIFWQCLNDSNWLVYASQAYDCIYEWLDEGERSILERDLFRPYADFISVQNPQYFNRIHNHATWACAGVGMIGLVMNDEELLDRALYGLKDVDIDLEEDDDGGQIRNDKAGFLAQIDALFSPDGYYAEGPYYQRYAFYPFMVFAASLQNARPDLGIFNYRDGILNKALFALLNLTDSDGEFYPINDGQKGMSYQSRELVSAVDIVYHFAGKRPELLAVAQEQNTVMLNPAGLSVAQDLKNDLRQDFNKKSTLLTDGPNGQQGGIGILRMNASPEINVVLKYSSQGMGHGHFDKLSFSMYDDGNEVIQDYGMARFVNIEQKNGGGYLKENKTFAKQTIAHNTLVVNERSNYDAKVKVGSKTSPFGHFFDSSSSEIQIVSAKDTSAYQGVLMIRTMAVINNESFKRPLVLDVFKVSSNQRNQYDLPLYYHGQLISTDFEFTTETELNTLGTGFGYQHLWKEAEGVAEKENIKFDWMNNGVFYSMTSVVDTDDQLILARTGANDPDFNLRRDPLLIIRKKGEKATTFVSIIEPHGSYSPVTEIAKSAFSNIKKIEILKDSEAYTAIKFSDIDGQSWGLTIANGHADQNQKHQLKIGADSRTWDGPYHYYKF